MGKFGNSGHPRYSNQHDVAALLKKHGATVKERTDVLKGCPLTYVLKGNCTAYKVDSRSVIAVQDVESVSLQWVLDKIAETRQRRRAVNLCHSLKLCEISCDVCG